MVRRLSFFCVLLLAGCSGAPEGPDYSRVCPERPVKVAVENQRLLDKVKPGTRLVDVHGLKKPEKMVTMDGPAAYRVAFFRVGVANCPLMVGSPNFMPVVIAPDSTVVGMGNTDVQKLLDQGWTIPAASWNWQSYNFAYLPHN